MKRPIAILGSILLSLALPAQAVIITALPGVGPQTAVQGTAFPVTPAVLVTQDDGTTPVVGMTVNFFIAGGIGYFADSSDFSSWDYAKTDSNGIATSAPLMAYYPGTAALTMEAQILPSRPTATVQLTTLPSVGAPPHIEIVSGTSQHAAVGSAYGAPWVVQVFDGSGNPAPDIDVNFVAPSEATVPSVTFAGASSVFVRTDANGIAVSPIPVANAVSGPGEGLATLNTSFGIQPAFFSFHNMSAGGSGGTGDGCGRQGKGNGNCGNSPAHSGGNGNNGNGKG